MGAAEESGADRRTRLGHLVRALRVLSYVNRVELVELLRAPHTLEEIRITPGDFRTGARPDRPLARQSVREHLEKLIDAGIVKTRTTRRDGRRRLTEYLVDQGRLFAISEELRRLAFVDPLERLGTAGTDPAVASASARWPAGPMLVIVHGVTEGRAFPLTPAGLRSRRVWDIGRREDVAVRLAYDPFVSRRHAEIRQEGEDFHLHDLGNARNGTFLNWTRLPLGGRHPLCHGDVIGTGQSLLLFRQD